VIRYKRRLEIKRSKFSERQVFGILKTVENARTVAEVCREHTVSESTYFNWKAKYGGMTTAEIKRWRELEEENSKLKRMSKGRVLGLRLWSALNPTTIPTT
jgi:putative transposase